MTYAILSFILSLLCNNAADYFNNLILLRLSKLAPMVDDKVAAQKLVTQVFYLNILADLFLGLAIIVYLVFT